MNNTKSGLRSRMSRPGGRGLGTLGCSAAVIVALLIVMVPTADAARTKLKPGWNIFSPQQDVELGRKVAQDAEQQFPLLNDRRVDSYLNDLGKRLAAKAPGERYPYQFKAINDHNINAFALPRGFIYVNRGVIESAETEAQLAGVIGHEIGHVALRHGTNQASKSYIWQAPLAVLGGVMGSDSLGGVLAQIGGGLVVNSVLLKYSRDAERQSDIIGTQILYDMGYDPRAMAQFFEKMEAEQKGGRPLEFFSSHPSPGNRRQKILREVENLGGPPRNYRDDSAGFRKIKSYLSSLPAPPKAGTNKTGDRVPNKETRGARLPLPTGRYQEYESDRLGLRYPDNWRAYGTDDVLTFAPEGGIVETGQGQSVLAHGMIVGLFEPREGRNRRITLELATDQLIYRLQESNSSLRVQRDEGRTRVGGKRGLSIRLTNLSPLGGEEVNWLVSVLRPEGLIYFVCVTPKEDYRNYRRTFQDIVKSIRFIN